MRLEADSKSGSEPSSKQIYVQDASTAHFSTAPAATANNAPKPARKWLSINPNGITSTLEVNKLRVHHQLGIRLRDLRLLDPTLASSYPSAILARDRALLVNLEFIKMIVGLDRVFITNLEDPNTNMFVEELQRRLAHPAGSATAMGVSPSTAALGAVLQSPSVVTAPSQPLSQAPLQPTERAHSSPHLAALSSIVHSIVPGMGSNHAVHAAPLMPHSNSTSHLASVHHPGLPHFEELSFDLRVLECALDVVSGYFEGQVLDLEATTHPALDALTQKTSINNLERVRRIKNRYNRLASRVETAKELLEKILDDDSNMKSLNLTAKETEREELTQKQYLRRSMSLSASTPFDVPLPSSGAPVIAQEVSLTTLSPQQQDPDASLDDLSDDEDVAVVEQLVEAYYMLLDNSWNKLGTLAEFIDDTEDLINIQLDAHRNQLIKLDLVLTAFTASVGLVTALTSLFAMNVTLSPQYPDKAPYSWFVTIAISTGVLAIVVFTAIVVFCKWRRLL